MVQTPYLYRMARNVSSKETMLTNIRNALINKAKQPFPNLEAAEQVYARDEDSLEVLFAQELQAVNGGFIFCEDAAELGATLKELVEIKNWTDILCPEPWISGMLQDNAFTAFEVAGSVTEAGVSIIGCDALIARTGSILISSRLASGRTLPVYPPVNIIIATTDQLVYDIQQGFDLLRNKYDNQLPSMVNLATGPSRTADIEKTLVLGAHGPREVYVFLLDKTE
jgi:L-lactate dehydrogenase complex protein LldG